MKNIIILVSVALFWIIFGTFVNYVAQDTTLQQISTIGNASYQPPNINISSFSGSLDEVTTKSIGWTNTFKILFGLGLPTTSMPHGMAAFISAINWLLILVMLIVMYRLIIPSGN